MCLILIAYGVHPENRFILAANRDEFYERPSAPLAYWEDTPQILAGRDRTAWGTWLGVTPAGRLAAITNYRNPSHSKSQAPTRGDIVRNYLAGAKSPLSYLQRLQKTAHLYNGFNLFVADDANLYYFSNVSNQIKKLDAGYFGLSNHLLNTPWPKVTKGINFLRHFIEKRSQLEPESLFGLLSDKSIPPDGQLPDTGIGLEWERRLGAIFISSPTYGTRCSSLVFMTHQGEVHFLERTFDTTLEKPEKPVTREFKFALAR
jgi:uncharacterized protein with NRDE domain